MLRSKLTAVAMAVTLGIGAVSASAADNRTRYDEMEPDAGDMMLDAVIVRPATLVASAVGLVAWVVTLPFSIPADDVDDTAREWVGKPLKYTFFRPLGEMEEGTVPAYYDRGQ
jgi:hypothetical protein